MTKLKEFLTFLAATTALASQPQGQEQIQKPLVAEAAPQVSLPQGRILGTVVQREDFPQAVDAFLGIPYAEPPVGPTGRFHPAKPVANSSEKVVDATEWGAKCPGRVFVDLGPKLKMDEDCLTVNVFRARGVVDGDGEKKLLPVGVYVHGGAFNRGTASQFNTDSMVAWSDEPFIGVSFNYRLGALGFLPSEVTAKEGVLNLGLKDQILLFKWVQDNIAAFGGDPNDVTLFGVSAGAHSIGHHLMNYNEEEPLFHRVIIESGAHTARAVHPANAPIHESQFKEFVAAAGCSEHDEASVMECLRTQPSPIITEASFDVFADYNIPPAWAFQPVIDHDIIKGRPTENWESGVWNKVPILTGYNHNEGTMYVPKTVDDPEEFLNFFRNLSPKLSEEDISEIDKLYPDPSKYPDSQYVDTRMLPNIGSQFKRLEAAYGQYAYVCNVRTTAKMASAGQTEPVYLYHWATNRTVLGGANHADQMAYETYDLSARETSPTHEDIAGFMHAYWTSFITQKGDPNKLKGKYAHRPVWEAYMMGEREEALIFGMGNDERAGGSERGIVAEMVGDVWAKEECEFWLSKALELDH